MKRKMFRKLMAASLATAMVVGMAGCGNGGGDEGGSSTPSESTPDSTSQESEPAGADESQPTGGEGEGEGEVSKYPVLTDENGNVYDLGGMEIKIWSWFEDNPTEDEYGEAQTEWREWIQDTYNFTLTQEALGSWGDCPQSFVDYVTTGGDENNYIFIGHSGAEMIAAMKNGLMYDVATLDCLDFSERKFQLSGQCNQFSKGDSVYAFATGYPEPRSGVFFNTRLLEETTGMTADDLYDLQKNNEWTWDKFEEIMKAIQAGGDTNNDGVQDIYAWCGNKGSFTTSSVYSNGGAYFELEDGKYVCKLEDPKTMKGLQWADDMIKNYLYPQPEGTEWNYFFDAFIKEGKFVFMPEDVYNMQPGNDLNTMEDDFGLLMFPIGPDADGYVNAYADNVITLPGCYDADRAWKIMFAYNLWTDDIPGFEDYNGRLNGYTNCVRDLRALDETLARMMSEGGRVKYDDFIPGINMGDDLTYRINGGTDIAAIIEEIRTKWETAAEEANK